MKKSIVFSLLLIFVGLFFFRDALLEKTISWGIKRLIDPSAQCEGVMLRGGKIVLSQFSLSRNCLQFSSEKVEVGFSLSDFRPTFFFSSPQLFLKKNVSPDFAISPYIFSWQIEAEDGTLLLEDEFDVQKIFFQWQRKDKQKTSLVFRLEKTPQIEEGVPLFVGKKEDLVPFFSLDVFANASNYQCALKLQAIDLARCVQIVDFFAPSLVQGIANAGGDIELESSFTIDRELKVKESSMHLELKQFFLGHAFCGWEIEGERLNALYHASAEQMFTSLEDLFKEAALTLKMEKGRIAVSEPLVQGEWEISPFDVEFSLSPKEKSQLSLTGILNKQGQSFPLSLKGKTGEGEEDVSLLDLVLALEKKDKEPFEVDLSLREGEQALHYLLMDFRNMESKEVEFLQDLFCFSYPQMHDVDFQEGLFNASVVATFQDRLLTALLIEKCEGDRVGFSLPLEGIQGYVEHFTLDAQINRGEKWEIENLHTEASGANFEVEESLAGPMRFLDSSVQFAIVDRQIAPSLISANIAGIPTQIELEGPYLGAHVKIQMETNCHQLLEKFSPSVAFLLGEKAVSLTLFVKGDEQGHRIEGETLIERDLLHFGALLSKEGNLSEGWFHSEKISSLLYSPLLSFFNKEIDIRGDIAVSGTFDEEILEGLVETEKLIVEHPLFSLSLPLKSSEEAKFISWSYQRNQNNWSAKIPLIAATCLEKQHGIFLEKIEGELEIREGAFSAKELQVTCSEMAFKGELFGNFEGVTLIGEEVRGKLEGMLALLQKCKTDLSWLPALRGELLCDKGGFSLRGDGEHLQAYLLMRLENICGKLSTDIAMEEASALFELDLEKRKASFQDTQGKLCLASGMVFPFFIPQLQWEKERANFQCTLLRNEEEITALKAEVDLKNPEEWIFAFDREGCHFLNQPLNITHLVVKKNQGISSLEMEPHFDLCAAGRVVNLLNEANLLSSTLPLKEMLEEAPLKGEISAKIAYDDALQTLLFKVGAKEIEVKEQNLGPLTLKGERIGNQWVIETVQIGPFYAKGSFLPQREEWLFPAFEIGYAPFFVKGEGIYKKQSGQFLSQLNTIQFEFEKIKDWLNWKGEKALNFRAVGKGEVTVAFPQENRPLAIGGSLQLNGSSYDPYPFSFQGERSLKFSYSKEEGLLVKDLFFQIRSKVDSTFLGRFEIGELFYKESQQQGMAKAIAFALSQNFFTALYKGKQSPEWLGQVRLLESCCGRAEVEFTPSVVKTQGHLKDVEVRIDSIPLNLSKMQWKSEGNRLLFSSSVCHQGVDLSALVQADFSNQPLYVLTLQDKPKAEGLKITISDNRCYSAQGSFFGLTCQLIERDPHLLEGYVECDFNALLPLIPKSMQEELRKLELGKGYRWEGLFSIFPFSFRGKLIGEEAEFFGCILDDLEADLEISGIKWLAHNLKVKDRALEVAVKQIKMERSGAKEPRWMLDAPLVQIHNFRPSLLRKKGKLAEKKKPFFIRDLSLFDLKGALDNPFTFTGQGHFHFTNSTKKSSNLLDIPIDLIKSLGLDLGLLTPVNGEVDYLIRSGKCCLTAIKNTYSEGRRSEFFLATDGPPSYFDFDSNLYIDLKMEQSVLIKFTEMFTLTIRGTLENPEYGLQ